MAKETYLSHICPPSYLLDEIVNILGFMAICRLCQLGAGVCLELGCEGRRVVRKYAKASLHVGWNWGRKKAQEVEMVHGPGARVGPSYLQNTMFWFRILRSP